MIKNKFFSILKLLNCTLTVALLLTVQLSLVNFVEAKTQNKLKTHEQKIFFLNLKDGQEVNPGYILKFGVRGMKVKEAGEITAGTGHHHLIINGSSIEKGQVIPKDEKHIHFGKGQTESPLDLTPGDYTLTLQFADGVHLSYGPQYSATVKIKVK